ncbi:hypothetical protein [Botryobacter ruber]|uniref:hypothetical protein n=1 Tax=Botryobacter ruber TaxID=2171629 RepID=UPI000F65259B|nr:hypothetical protein [Botryobacter ruber]
MDYTHIHLLLNHFPIVGTLTGAGVMVWGVLRNEKTVKAVAAVNIMAVTVMTIPVFLAGESAEERVEHLPGVSERVIEEHEVAAERFGSYSAGRVKPRSVLMMYALSPSLRQ